MLEELRNLNNPEINNLLDKMEAIDDPSIFLDKIKDLESRLEEKVSQITSDLEAHINIIKSSLEELSEEMPDKGNPGEDGEDYILTSEDKKEIAKEASSLIKVPVVKKIIEKTEVVKEQPIHYETIKEITHEVENKDTGEQIIEKINQDEFAFIKKEKIEDFEALESDIRKRAIDILDQRTQFLINKKPRWGNIEGYISQQTDVNLQSVTDNGATTTKSLTVGGLTVTGSRILKFTSVAVDTTLDDTHEVVEVTAPCTITLPTAVGITGRTYSIKNTSGTIITIGGAETIEGHLSVTSSDRESYKLISNGSNWLVI